MIHQRISISTAKGATSECETSSNRVLFLTRKWGPAVGGMETYCERLTEELNQSHDVDIIALKGRSDGRPPHPLALLVFPVAVAWRMLTLKNKPTTIHLADMAIWPLGLLANVLLGPARLIISAHGTDVAFGARGGLRGRLYSAYLRIGGRLLPSMGVIANSHATRDRLKQFGWSTAAIIPLATDMHAEPALPPKDIEMVFAGRLVQRKGCGWFVREVIPRLPKTARLKVIGTTWDAEENTVLEHPQVDFLGPMPPERLAKCFSEATCVVVPNIDPVNGEYEGFGLVAPEGASAGGVVIAAATGGLRDAVIDNVTGFLLPPEDPEAWARKIEEIHTWNPDEREAFIAKSQTTARCEFTWSRVAFQTSEAYGQCD